MVGNVFWLPTLSFNNSKKLMGPAQKHATHPTVYYTQRGDKLNFFLNEPAGIVGLPTGFCCPPF